MKKYMIGFFSVLFLITGCLIAGYQVSYNNLLEKEKAIELTKNEKNDSIQTRRSSAKGESVSDDAYYLKELHGYVAVYLQDGTTLYETTSLSVNNLPDEEEQAAKPIAVIGVVEGDTHDIGKNLVKIMMETAGFEMHDLGRDVPAEEFVNQAEALKAQLVCISTLMTTTMSGMEDIIELLKERGIRDNVKVMVGGSPVSKKYANDIGADGYSVNAVEAVRVAKELLNIA